MRVNSPSGHFSTSTAAVVLTLLLTATLALLGAAPAHADGTAEALAARVNDERVAHGRAPLTHVRDLQAVAQQQAQAMAARGGLFHDPALGDRVRDWSRLTENVGQAADLESVHAALMASPGHRANVLDPGVAQIGVGAVWAGGRLWVSQVFRQPVGAAASAEPVSRPTPPFVQPAFCAGAPAAPFTDVRRDAWFAGAVDCAVGVALVNGVTPTSYAPSRPVTRAQMASLLHRVVLRSTSAGAADGAPDLFADDAGSPHERAINALAHLDVVHGTAPGRYSPQGYVTRAQAVSMLVRLHERLAGPLRATGASFVDVGASAHAEAIDKATSAGIATGTTATTFSPGVEVRRDLAAVLLVRTFSGLRDAGALR